MSTNSIHVDTLPEAIRQSTRAVLWKLETRDGQPTKVPYCAERPHEKASTTDPTTWARFETALRVFKAGRFDGVGIVLGDGRAGIDIDKCRDPETGLIDDEARAIIAHLNSYTEVSPSGRGVHILIRGALPPGRRKIGRPNFHIEMYDDGRYFTLSGHHVEGTPKTIEQRTAELATLHARVFPHAGTGDDTPRAAGPPRSVSLDDAALLERAHAAANGVKFAALWRGDTSTHGGDESAADLALCNLLAFWTACDASRMDALFRQSGLMRDKWNSRRGESTYGAQTMATAIASCRETFTGPVMSAPRDAPRPAQASVPAPPSSSELYGFQRLQARPRQIVFIAERTSDVDALVRIDVPATCLAAGGGWGREHVQQLQRCGIRLACILVTDATTGGPRAAHIVSTCHAAGVIPRILPLSGTVANWIAGGGTRQRLIDLADAMPTWQPAAAAKPPAAPPTSLGHGAERRPMMVRLEDVQPASVSWLWERRLARGMLTLLVGDGGLGKSTVSLSLAATLSKGARWPDKGHAPIGKTIILSAEDSLSVTIRPRLDALGADVCQIRALAAIQDGPVETSFNLARDLDMLERAVIEVNADLVIVDPLGAYFGAADSYKDTDVRAVLAPLAALADRLNVCVLGVMHISKGTDRSAQHRVLGSVGFVNAARLVLAVGRHPDDHDLAAGRRLLAPLKQNICAPADTLAFSMVADGDDASDGVRLVWSSERVDGVSADQVLGSRPSSPRDREDQTEAEQVITGMLTEESWPLDAKQAIAAGREHGIPERTLRWTAKRMGIAIEKKGFRNGWQWHRPPQPATVPADEPARSLSPVAVAASAPIAASRVSEQIRGCPSDAEGGIPEAASGNDNGEAPGDGHF